VGKPVAAAASERSPVLAKLFPYREMTRGENGGEVAPEHPLVRQSGKQRPDERFAKQALNCERAMQIRVEAAIEKSDAANFHCFGSLLTTREEFLCDRDAIIVGHNCGSANAEAAPHCLGQVRLLMNSVAPSAWLVRIAEAQEIECQYPEPSFKTGQHLRIVPR